MIALASPASLKGVLTPLEAAASLAAGLRRIEGVEVDEAPVADGGEGTAMVLAQSLGGEWHEAVVSDPLGRAVTADWLLLPDGTGVVECAAAVGLPRLRPSELDPLRASSRGAGELVVAALEQGAVSLLVCVGGVATVDGGVGMRDALGDALGTTPLRVACDVRNPLLGARGAAHVFGPQKGADADAVDELEARLASLEAELADRGEALEHVREALAFRWAAAEKHLLFFQGTDGYELVERDGPPPRPGTKVGEHVVVRISAGTLPGEFPCAYLVD